MLSPTLFAQNPFPPLLPPPPPCIFSTHFLVQVVGQHDSRNGWLWNAGPLHRIPSRPSTARTVRAFRDHYKSSECMTQGARHWTNSFQVWCDSHTCVTRDEMQLAAYLNTLGTDSIRSGEKNGVRTQTMMGGGWWQGRVDLFKVCRLSSSQSHGQGLTPNSSAKCKDP